MSIKQKAREIAERAFDSTASYPEKRFKAARLGIIEGRRQAFEEAAKVAEEGARAKSYSESPFESGAGFERIKIAAAIRSLK